MLAPAAWGIGEVTPQPNKSPPGLAAPAAAIAALRLLAVLSHF
jgi:hypothetical protein